ncbi:MAG: hypothetical protein QM536_05360 [Chitinophagaceae bacterium]|nr:hypothetical protein [Chitinophagaceae bacterium]
MSSLKTYLSSTYIVFCFSTDMHAQLFDNPKNTAIVKKGIDYIYNYQFDSGRFYRKKISFSLPNHPVLHLMDAMLIQWEEMPLKDAVSHNSYKAFLQNVEKVVETAHILKQNKLFREEALFFELVGRGLLGEYFSEEGSYIKAASEAKAIYNILEEGNTLVNKNPEFLFMIGVYNYFRVKYEQLHPLVKPLIWFLREGNIQLGLAQIERATKETFFIKVEATMYISFINIRFEKRPDVAIAYLTKLTNEYPHNPFFKIKLVEAMVNNGLYAESLPIIHQLMLHANPYYTFSAQVYASVIIEKKEKKYDIALASYLKAIEMGHIIQPKGQHYLSVAYLGGARIYIIKGEKQKAIKMLSQAKKYARYESTEQEASLLLKKI